jgi:hypothetical protein
MHKRLVILVLAAFALLILALNYEFLYSKIIGLVTLEGINVSVEEKVNGKLLLAFDSVVELGEEQNILSEFINIGSTPVTTKIEVRIHQYVNGTLKPLAYYYDISTSLNPGMRKAYEVIFVPPDVGLYYIQARATYENKLVEVWAAFFVFYPPATATTYSVTTVTIQPTIPVAPVIGGPLQAILGAPKLGLEYPEKITVLQGKSTLINITARNTGNITLNNLKTYISTTSLINFVVNPKQVAFLSPKSSTIFLIAIDIPSTTPEGSYAFDFEVTSDETEESGKIDLQVKTLAAPEEEEIHQKILNYEFLISEIEKEILSTSSKGFDVGLANMSLSSAKASLESANGYFKLKKYKETREELEKVKRSLEDAVFQLASATLYVYRPPSITLYLMLLLLLLIIAAILIYYYYKKRQERRPKLLRAMSETETETEK